MRGADIVTHAALYMVGIALNHPFLDGNKRTGYIAGMTFLQVNSYLTIDATFNDPQMGVWLEQVVNRTMSFEDFVERLEHRLSGHLRRP
jgi:prophage maintenance system killer protein